MLDSTALALTRESLRALACYVISPFRHGRERRIGLRPIGQGFGTPVLVDGTQLVVDGDRLIAGPDRWATITTLRDAAAFTGVELAPDPPVGHDLPEFDPDRPLAVDAEASRALGAWWAFGAGVLADVGEALAVRADGTAVSEAQLWPEHFDLAVVVQLPGDVGVNAGFSPGDSGHDAPYVYVGPHDPTTLADDPFWNAPFGALRNAAEIMASPDPHAAAYGFVLDGLTRAR